MGLFSGDGTGLLSYYWYVQCSSAKYMLVDMAEQMPFGRTDKKFLRKENFYDKRDERF